MRLQQMMLVATGACGLALACAVPEGSPWVELETTEGPSRWGHVAVYDPARDRMMVFGGQGETGQSAEVWTLDMATERWALLETGPGPIPRTDLASFLDAPRDRYVVVGGRVGFAESIDEVWALDLGTLQWSELPRGPSIRHDIAGATDGERAWIFGGAGELFQSLEDLWELDLETDTWRELPSNGDAHPDARTSAAFGYWDGALYLHGGHDVASVTRDTWRYDLASGTWTKLDLEWGTVAGAHFGHSVDPLCGNMLLTGGDNLDNFATALSDALVLGDSPRYERLRSSALPAARDHTTLVVDTTRHRMVLFAGGRLGDGLGTLRDTWVRSLDGCL